MIKATYTTIQKEIKVIETLACSRCNVTVKSVYPEYISGLQPKDALIVKLGGGYGMYFDDSDEGDIISILCKECADQLKFQFPELFES